MFEVTLLFKITFHIYTSQNTNFSEVKTQVVPVRDTKWLETEDQLHKPFSGEFILTAPERQSRKKTEDLVHINLPTCVLEQREIW